MKLLNTYFVIILITIFQPIQAEEIKSFSEVTKKMSDFKKDYYSEDLDSGVFSLGMSINKFDTILDSKDYNTIKYSGSEIQAKCYSYDLRKMTDLRIQEIIVREHSHTKIFKINAKFEKEGFCSLLFVPEWMTDNEFFKLPFIQDLNLPTEVSIAGVQMINVETMKKLNDEGIRKVFSYKTNKDLFEITAKFNGKLPFNLKVRHNFLINNKSVLDFDTSLTIEPSYPEGQEVFRTLVNLLDVNGDGELDFILLRSTETLRTYRIFLSNPEDGKYRYIEYDQSPGC